MKKLVLAVFLLCSIHGFAQVGWTTSIGATWYFDYNNWVDFGVMKRVYTSDTIINGKQYQVLVDTYYKAGYDFTNGTPPEYVLDTIMPYGKRFLEISGDSVFQYFLAYDTVPEQRYLLYNFGAQIGDEWNILPTGYWNCTISKVVVTNKGVDTINGQPYRWITLTSPNNSGYGIWGKINEHFGPMQFDMFPEQWSVCDSNIIFDGTTCFITCFSDNVIDYHKPGINYCNFLSDIKDEPAIANTFTLYPNPTREIVNINTSYTKSYQLILFDITGKTVLAENNKAGNIAIDISGLNSGIYLLQIHTANGVFTKKLIVE